MFDRSYEALETNFSCVPNKVSAVEEERGPAEEEAGRCDVEQCAGPS